MANTELVSLLYWVGFILTVAGMVILAVNMLFQKKRQGRSGFGGVILIGPFPIVFGTSRRMMKIMLVIALVFIAVILLTTFLNT